MSERPATFTRRVLVTQSYFLRFDPKLQAAGKPVPPLGSLMCAAYLRARGFDVAHFDAMLAQTEQECADALDRVRPEALVIFEDSFNYLSKMCLDRMRQAASTIIGGARARNIRVIVAGPAASDDPEFFLRAGASAVARGEGELSVAEWLEADGGGAGNIRGVTTLDPDGHLLSGVPRSPERDLDALPPPAWDLADPDRYRRVWLSRHGRFEMPLATSRGCPFHCNWCAKPIWGQRYNVVTPARAASDVERLKALGATYVNVLDDIFGLKPGWLEEFTIELERRDSKLPFRCLSRADLLDDTTVAALARAGCETVWIGAESGSQKILDAMEKGVTVAQIRAAAGRLRRSGIRVCLFIQYGYPGEVREDIEATLELIDEVLPDDIGISVSYPLPGTPFHERVRQEMGARAHWQDSSDLAMLFGDRRRTGFYRWLHAHTHARFRLARALRINQDHPARRALRVIRYGAARVITAAGLAVEGRER